MAVTPVWKVRLLILLSRAETWLRNIFSTPAMRRARYHQMVAEEAFEAWMNYGVRFESHIRGYIAAAERSGHAGNIRFWCDVLDSAQSFDADPENRRKRDEMAMPRRNAAARSMDSGGMRAYVEISLASIWQASE